MANNDLLKIDFTMVIQIINFLIMVTFFGKTLVPKLVKS